MSFQKKYICNYMGVLIGIDFGKKRVGLACTDPNKMIANGLSTIPKSKVMEYLNNFIKETKIEKFVVGQPIQRSGNYSYLENDILLFINELKKNFESIPVVRQDERFTSKIAYNTILTISNKKSLRKNKFLIDKISATLILQSYLESIKKSTS